MCARSIHHTWDRHVITDTLALYLLWEANLEIHKHWEFIPCLKSAHAICFNMILHEVFLMFVDF